MALEFPSTTDASKPRGAFALPFGERPLKAMDRIAFTEQLALLLETGTSLHLSLEALRRQADKSRMRDLIKELGDEIAAGKSFATALSRHPELFSATYINLIAAGEQGGFLPEALKQLQGLDERQERLQSTLVSTLSYPVFLLVFSAAVVVLVLVVVFPKFAEMFNTIRDQLPFTTLLLMAASDLLRQYWIGVIAATAGLAAALVSWSRSAPGRAVWDRAKLYAPGLRTLFVQLYVISTFRVMSLSLANGVSVIDAFDACREVVNNCVFRRFLERTKEHVLEGGGITKAFAETDFIPASVRQMISTAESTGKLAPVMAKLADFYERDLERKITLFAKIIEPLMLLVMGLIVGLIVSSLILPIFKLSRAVR
jgi:type II secretory pathway component PulF